MRRKSICTDPSWHGRADCVHCAIRNRVLFADLPPEELAKVPKTPGSLRDVLKALEADHEYLLKGDVFTPDVIETWIDYKYEKEVNPVRMRPSPLEFQLYFDI